MNETGFLNWDIFGNSVNPSGTYNTAVSGAVSGYQLDALSTAANSDKGGWLTDFLDNALKYGAPFISLLSAAGVIKGNQSISQYDALAYQQLLAANGGNLNPYSAVIPNQKNDTFLGMNTQTVLVGGIGIAALFILTSDNKKRR